MANGEGAVWLWRGMALACFSAALATVTQARYGFVPVYLILCGLFLFLSFRPPTIAAVYQPSRLYRWIGALALIITWGLFVADIAYPTVSHWIKPPPPLADDAIKWQVANHLYNDRQGTDLKPPQPICVMHLDTDYSESLAHNITDILKLAGYSVAPCVRTGGADIPKGISVWSSRQGGVASHGEAIQNRFRDIAKLSVDFSFLDEPNLDKPFPLCIDSAKPCLAITVGNPIQP